MGEEMAEVFSYLVLHAISTSCTIQQVLCVPTLIHPDFLPNPLPLTVISYTNTRSFAWHIKARHNNLSM